MDDLQEWMWLLKTDKEGFFITVVGKWTQEEAAKKVRVVFDVLLKLTIVAMIPRKRIGGPDEIQCTIYEQQGEKDEHGFDFLAGKRVWEACGRGAEFEAELVLQKSQR